MAGAVAVLGRADRRAARPGRRRAAPGSAGVGQRLLDLGRAEAQQLDDAGRRRVRLARADDGVLKAPAPAVACARHAAPILGVPKAAVTAQRSGVMPQNRTRPPVPRPKAGRSLDLRSSCPTSPPSSPAARGAPTRSRSTGATTTTTPPPARAEAADAAIAALRERGSPSHDGLAARLVGPRGATTAGSTLDLQPTALGAAPGRGRRVALGRRAVRHARRRRALAGRPPRAVAVVVAGALGAGRRRRGRRRREPGRHAHARAATRSGRSPPSASRSRRSCACRTGW